MKIVTDIEKQIIVERVYNDIWQCYLQRIAYGQIVDTMQGVIKKPALQFFCKGTGLAGQCWWKRVSGGVTVYGVRINTAYFDGMHDAGIKETITHELAHYFTWLFHPDAKQAHGPEFRHMMQAMGYAGDTYHHMSVSKAKIVAQHVKKGNDLFDLS